MPRDPAARRAARACRPSAGQTGTCPLGGSTIHDVRHVPFISAIVGARIDPERVVAAARGEVLAVEQAVGLLLVVVGRLADVRDRSRAAPWRLPRRSGPAFLNCAARHAGVGGVGPHAGEIRLADGEAGHGAAGLARGLAISACAAAMACWACGGLLLRLPCPPLPRGARGATPAPESRNGFTL